MACTSHTMQEGSTRIRKTAPFKQFQQKAPPQGTLIKQLLSKELCLLQRCSICLCFSHTWPCWIKGKDFDTMPLTDAPQMFNSNGPLVIEFIYIFFIFFCPHPPPAPPQNGGSFKNEATYAINGRLLGATCQWKTFDCCGV